MFLDCRPGTEAIYDAFVFAQPDGTRLVAYDFEDPVFKDGQDVVYAVAAPGTASWMVTAFCQAPATSKVVSAISSQVYSDPSISADIEALKKAVRKYEL